MEAREIIKFIKKHLPNIILSGVLFGLIGGAINFYYPNKYYASGSLYIRRTIYPYSDDHFTYEGYYSQQAAIFYTNSISGLIESEDIRSQALTKLGVLVNEKTLRNYDKKIRTTKNGPQLLTLIIKEDSPERASELWQAISDTTITTLSNINQRGDPFLSVAKVVETPVVKESYREPWVFMSVGTLLGILFSVCFLSLKSYFKSPKKK